MNGIVSLKVEPKVKKEHPEEQQMMVNCLIYS